MKKSFVYNVFSHTRMCKGGSDMGIGGVSDVLRSASTLYGQGKVLGDVGTAVLSKSLDVQQQQGDALTKMMERSVTPAVGGNFDMSV